MKYAESLASLKRPKVWRVSDLKKLRQLKEENHQLKKLVADLSFRQTGCSKKSFEASQTLTLAPLNFYIQLSWPNFKGAYRGCVIHTSESISTGACCTAKLKSVHYFNNS
jgi:hypothetical protein